MVIQLFSLFIYRFSLDLHWGERVIIGRDVVGLLVHHLMLKSPVLLSCIVLSVKWFDSKCLSLSLMKIFLAIMINFDKYWLLSDRSIPVTYLLLLLVEGLQNALLPQLVLIGRGVAQLPLILL